MDKSGKIILVTGATGRQGGAAAHHLLKAGWQVRILARDPDKPAAVELGHRGAQAFRGDFDDTDSLHQALEGCYGAFSVQNVAETGPERETSQGKQFADAAREAGIQHFVYSSVGAADKKTGVPHFESKWQIEQHIAAVHLPATILRPVFFMDNFLRPDMADAIHNGTLAMPLEEGTRLQMIAVHDIGGMAAKAFDEPDEFIGKAIDLAGDELTMPETARQLSRVLDRPVEFVQIPLSKLERQSADMAAMFRWFNQAGYDVNVEAVRAIYPALMNFDAWLEHVQFAQARPATIER